MNQKLDSIMAELTILNRSIEEMLAVNSWASIDLARLRARRESVMGELVAMIPAEQATKPTLEMPERATPNDLVLAFHHHRAESWLHVSAADGFRVGEDYARRQFMPLIEAMEAERDILKLSGLLMTEENAALKAEVERLRDVLARVERILTCFRPSWVPDDWEGAKNAALAILAETAGGQAGNANLQRVALAAQAILPTVSALIDDAKDVCGVRGDWYRDYIRERDELTAALEALKP